MRSEKKTICFSFMRETYWGVGLYIDNFVRANYLMNSLRIKFSERGKITYWRSLIKSQFIMFVLIPGLSYILPAFISPCLTYSNKQYYHALSKVSSVPKRAIVASPLLHRVSFPNRQVSSHSRLRSKIRRSWFNVML